MSDVRLRAANGQIVKAITTYERSLGHKDEEAQLAAIAGLKQAADAFSDLVAKLSGGA
jgi:hypothetical protein